VSAVVWIPGFLIALLIVASAPSALGADYVIAVIDPNRVVEQSPQYEAARQELQKEVAEREQRLLEQQAQLAELQEKLERDAALMSNEEIQRLKNDIRNRDRKLKYAQAEAREDLTLRQNEMRTKLGKQVEEVVTELAREKSIDLIVSGEDVFYFSERIDISDEVVERMKLKYEAK
jgi:outer membrane protein